jgi:acetyltransferase-like isoleucine patch superfamily enzyme
MPPRDLAKHALRGAATVVLAPALVSFAVRARLAGRDAALAASSEALALLPGVGGEFLRRAFFGRALARCHPTSLVAFGATFSRAETHVDENVYIGPGCEIGLAHIERDVLIAAGVRVAATPGDRPVRIGAGSWIGSRAVILADVGRGTIVAAGAVVSEPLPDHVVAGGVPARVLRARASHDDR